MISAARNSVRCCGAARQAAVYVGLSLAAFLPLQLSTRGQEVRPEGGLFITVRNPITSEVVRRIVAKTDRALAGGKVAKIIFDFNPAGHPALSEDYGACRDLAAHLLNLKQCQTIAFVHNEVTGHTV